MFYCVEMKIDSKIVDLFEKHEAKKIAYSLTPFVVDDVRTKDGGLFLAFLGSAPPLQSDTKSDTENEYETPHPP
jgi:hypothetical protein